MKRADPFYLTPRWRALRLEALKRDRWRCVVCKASVAGKGQASVDHIKPRRLHPELALDINNLRSLCRRCDNQSHREKGSGDSKRVQRFVVSGCNTDAMPLDPNHPWRRQ